MKKKRVPVTYEARYKHKLNMPEPETVMLKRIGIFIMVGFVLRLFELKLVSSILFALQEQFSCFCLLLKHIGIAFRMRSQRRNIRRIDRRAKAIRISSRLRSTGTAVFSAVLPEMEVQRQTCANGKYSDVPLSIGRSVGDSHAGYHLTAILLPVHSHEYGAV